MKHCNIHKIDFSYTCSVCEASYNYAGRTQYLDAFTAGARGETEQPQWQNDPQQHAAYLHGKEFANPVGKKEENKRHKGSKQNLTLSQGDLPMAKKQTQSQTANTGLSFEQMVGSATVTDSDSTHKSTKPTIKLDAEKSKALVSFLDAKKEMKDAEAVMRSEEGPLLEHCLNRQDIDGLAGKFSGSYSVVTEDGKTKATFISQDKFNVNSDFIETLKTLLGTQFNEEVKAKHTVTLKPEVFEDETLKAELVKLLGASFGKFFQTVTKYELKDGFDERLYKIAGNPANVAQLRHICGKSKPYIK